MDWKNFSKKGGTATKKKYGTSHFSKMGKKGVEALRKKVPPDFFKVTLPNYAKMARIKKKLLKESGSLTDVETIPTVQSVGD